MKITDQGIINQGETGTSRAVSTFPTVTALADGSLLASYRIATDKDSADGTIELRRSYDGGRTWSAAERPFKTKFDGVQGSLRVGYVTAVSDDHLIAVSMWLDREAYPGKGIFNEETEGCLPAKALLADSHDQGRTWSAWRHLTLPDDVGPPSLTNPIIRLASGRLITSIETNKQYHDTGPWMQRVVYVYSEDGGQTWSAAVTTCQDPTGRIFNWDQRAGVATDGRLATFTWTYDRETTKYHNIHRRISDTEGASWTQAEDLGFADQAARPAMLPDGRVVLAWVDRFGAQAIKARMSAAVDAAFLEETEVDLYRLEAVAETVEGEGDTGELLTEMGVWNYGLPYAEVLPDGDVMVVYYAGEADRMDIHWARLAL
jgi:hypothetical protein